MTDTAQALARRTESKNTQTIMALIERQRPAIELALPQAIGAERFARIAITEIRRQPLLQACDPYSVLGALMLCAQLGLEPGPLGHAYLVPFKTECTFILGYRGMIELARRSERLGSLTAEIVYEGDEFDFYRTERGAKMLHRPCPVESRGDVVSVYCQWTALAGPRVQVPDVRVITKADCDAAKKRSPSGSKGKGPWITDEPAMQRKTAVRRAAPFLPMSPLFGRALDADDRGVVTFDPSDGEVELEAVEDAQATEGSGGEA